MEDKEANNKEAVWNLLGRHSKVGKELFKLYYQGAQTGADVGNRYSDHNLEAYRKKLASGWTPPKPGATVMGPLKLASILWHLSEVGQ